MSYSFVTPQTGVCQTPLSMEFSRQESWGGLPFPPPGDLLDPWPEPRPPHCRQILYCLSQSVIPSKFQQALLWKLKADSNIYIEMQMPRIATMFLKENKAGEKSCCWDMRHTKKWGRWSRRRRKGEREEKKTEGFCGHVGDGGCLGGMFKGQIYVSYLLLGPHIWCWLWNVPGSRLWIWITLSGVEGFWDRSGGGLLRETGQQRRAAAAKVLAGPLAQTIQKTPSRDVEGLPKTLQAECHTVLTTEGMKPESIWFSQ